MKNHDGYSDLTVYYAMRNIEIEGDAMRLIGRMREFAGWFGFEIEGRIILKHKKTGRVFK